MNSRQLFGSLSMLLCSSLATSAVAAPRLVTKTWGVGANATPASTTDEPKDAYYINLEIPHPEHMNCPKAFATYRELLIDPAYDYAHVSGSAGCSYDDDDESEAALSFGFTVEYAVDSEAQLPALTEFVNSLEGQLFYGEPLHFEKAL
jgi:hypothetical protein